MRISYEIDKKEAQALRERVQDQLEALKDTRTPLAKMAIILYQSVMKNFAEQGNEKGKWQALSPFTIMARRRGKKGNIGRAMKTTGRPITDFNAKILQDTGYMKASIYPKVEQNTAVVGLNGEEAVIGRVHQFGKGRVPARPFLTLRPEYQERIVKIASDWLKTRKHAEGSI